MMSGGSEKLSPKDRSATCSFVMPSLVVIQFLQLGGHGKITLFDRFCAGDIDEHMNIFLDLQVTKEKVIEGGIVIFQHIYHAPGTKLGAI